MFYSVYIKAIAPLKHANITESDWEIETKLLLERFV